MVARYKQRHLKGFLVKTMSITTSLIAGAMMISFSAQAQNSSMSGTISPQKSEAFQALCRVKAKESANLAFKSCMNENKSAEIESIRKGYQERLEQIKAQYEQELSKVSGKLPKAAPTKQDIKSSSKPDESQLMKNAILEDSTDEIQETSQLIEQKSSDETESGRLIDKSQEKKEMSRDSQLPKAPVFFESAGQSGFEKREPKEPQTPPKTKREKVSFKNQIAAASKSKAILFNDLTEAPEPIPVEAMNAPLSHQ